ncbi:RnfABCDGE type electron transport complex subunit D [Oricola nitratireducens]|uniref:RnfABCDGE type electron transport complex subunit D n=1 Tax=Oricola nitratireducens TaxID=2775868 RepID=UPI001868D02F|nr:RnfABCDGE type electron transport complex subunit D [Oricola nitratireducens]
MIKFIDARLNHITMYRLVLFYVGALLAAAFVAGLFGIGLIDPTALAFTAFFVAGICYLTNRLFAALFRVPVNSESVWITAIILVLIMPPTTADDVQGLQGLALASFVAVASKFLLAFRKRHVFNPVAIGVVASSFLLDQPPIWWVASNLALLPLVVIGGLLVLRKVQRFEMVGAFVGANIIATLLLARGVPYLQALDETLRYSPVLFAGFAMLTEPLTAPLRRSWRLVFGILVGVLSAQNVAIGNFYFSTELALLAGNLMAFAVNPHGRFRLTLVGIEKIATGCYDYVFRSDRSLPFRPGQYVDWTMNVRCPDDRGNRRPFTIASAPGEQAVRLGVKFYAQPSAFKRSLLSLRPGDVVYASHVSGDFTLPRDPAEKLVFIAGGIGITPFRSMIQDLIDRSEARPLVLFYGNNRSSEIAYADVLNNAERKLGIRTVYAVRDDPIPGSNMYKGLIDADMIASEVPDFRDRTFYVSGPRAMVLNFRTALRELGVARSRIRVDYFPGFA